MTESRFTLAIKNSRSMRPLLPLVHTCEAYDFRGILENQMVKPSECDTFKNELLSYFFYGKPSYRTAKNMTSASMNALFPICFVIDNPSPIKPKRLFPVDSGAFAANLFSEFFHKKSDISDLSLRPELESAGKVVSHFFGKNLSYFDSIPKHTKIGALEFEAQSYYELIKSRAPTVFDDRRSSIEIQYDEPINLADTNVHMVILPTAFMDEKSVREVIVDKWQSEIRTYHTSHCNPNEYVSLINRELRDYLIDEGYL